MNQICAADSIENATHSLIKKRKSASNLQEKKVEPLLGEIAWDQGYPYNLFCPPCGEDRCVTGCVATAIAQIMYYHKWPEHGTGTVGGYLGYDTGEVDFSKSHYQWDLMHPTYDDNSDMASKEAVALLMHDVGYAINSVYGSIGTSAQTWDVPKALANNFDYDLSLSLKERIYIEDEEWDNMLISEIDHQRPCYYSGGEHAFVCDGYDYSDNNVYFHFNFGWSGMVDGYFLSKAILEYNDYQEAVIGIKKNEGGECHADLYTNDLLEWKTYDDYPWNEIFVGDTFVSIIGNNRVKRFTGPALFIENIATGSVSSLTGQTPSIPDDEVFETNWPHSVFEEITDGEYRIYLGSLDLTNNDVIKCNYPKHIESYVALSVKDGKFTVKNYPENGLAGDGIEFIDGIYYSLSEDTKTAIVENRDGNTKVAAPSYHGTIEIPNTIIFNGEEYKVTGIGELAFFGCMVEQIFIPKNIEYISRSAFARTRIKEVLFEDDSHLTKIGHSAFWECDFLRSISLPQSLKEIDTGAFNKCRDLKKIDIPISVERMGEDVFTLSYMTDISVHWPNPKDMTGSFDFSNAPKVVLHVPEGCSQLYKAMECWSMFDIVEGEWSEKIKVGDLWYRLNGISKTAKFTNPEFSENMDQYPDCITLPASIEYEGISYTVDRIDSYSLNATKTSEIHIPKTVKAFDTYAFAYNNLEKIVFEDNSELTEIGSYAFFASKLAYIDLPDGLEKMGHGVFMNTKLSFLRIPNSVMEIGEFIFPFVFRAL